MPPSSSYRQPAFWLPAIALILVIVAAMPFAGARSARTDTTTKAPAPAPQIQPVYAVSAGIDGEIFPAIANFASSQKPWDRQFPTVSVKIVNGGDTMLTDRVSVSVPGWSDQEIQMVDVAPGVTRTFHFAPTFLPRFYGIREITPATVAVHVSDAAGHAVYATTVPVRLRATEDMYWGAHFRNARFIAAWVTPHDPMVEEVLSRAKEYMPGRRLPGYEEWKNSAAQTNSTYQQAKAIYTAFQRTGVSYVKSSMTFGANQEVSERVRLPRETLRRSSANCIDGAVLYAAAFENLGMDPIIVLVPGHAYVGVREAENSDNYLYIETSLTGRSSFESSVLSANRGLGKVNPSDVLQISIAGARAQGIYPMPLPALGGIVADTTATRSGK
ncbi:MAG: hypothetical protein ACRD3E_03100 [Terriglobales bacterium]